VRPKPTDEGMPEKIAEGLIAGKGIREVCAPDTMPSVTEVYVEMARNEEFRNIIARARELQQEAHIDETVELADAATVADWQVVKLRIWARQWRAGKLAPKKYGDKIVNEHTGADGGPIQTEATVIDAASMTSEERATMRAILEAAQARKGGA
jgi:hypothetical protein